MISDLLVGCENPVSFSFRFRRNLIKRKMTEVTSLLSLVEGCRFREGMRDIRVWSSNPSQGYTCKPFFSWLLDPSPPRESIFDVVRSTKVSKKVKIFIWQILLDRVNTVLIGLLEEDFACWPFLLLALLKGEKTLTTFLGIVSMLKTCGAFLCKSLALAMPAIEHLCDDWGVPPPSAL